MNFYGLFPSAGGSGGSSGTPFQEIPAGAVNNVNKTFTLTHVPTANAAVSFYIDGLIQVQGVDYTIAGTIITTTVAPNFAQVPYAVYSF